VVYFHDDAVVGGDGEVCQEVVFVFQPLVYQCAYYVLVYHKKWVSCCLSIRGKVFVGGGLRAFLPGEVASQGRGEAVPAVPLKRSEELFEAPHSYSGAKIR
jgi:hypothetical protein